MAGGRGKKKAKEQAKKKSTKQEETVTRSKAHDGDIKNNATVKEPLESCEGLSQKIVPQFGRKRKLSLVGSATDKKIKPGDDEAHETQDNSTTNVKDSATNVKDSTTNVKDSTTNVKDSATNVKDSATNVKDSATNVKDSATNVKDSATNVKDSATNVKDSTTNVKDSATNVKDSATNVKDSTTNVKDSATNVKDSATNEEGITSPVENEEYPMMDITSPRLNDIASPVKDITPLVKDGKTHAVPEKLAESCSSFDKHVDCMELNQSVHKSPGEVDLSVTSMLSNQKQAVDGKLTAAAIDTLPGCNAQEVQTETSGGDSLQIVERTPSEKHDGNIAMGFDTGASNSKSNGAGIVIEMLGSFDSVGTVGEELSKIAPNEEIRHKLIEDTVIEMGGALQHKEIETDKTMELDEPDIGELDEPDIGELDEPDIGELDEPDIGELDEPDIGELGEPDIGGLDEPDIGDNRKGGEESGDERMEGEGSKLRGNQEQSDVCQNEGDIINGHNDSKEPTADIELMETDELGKNTTPQCVNGRSDESNTTPQCASGRSDDNIGIIKTCVPTDVIESVCAHPGSDGIESAPTCRPTGGDGIEIVRMCVSELQEVTELADWTDSQLGQLEEDFIEDIAADKKWTSSEQTHKQATGNSSSNTKELQIQSCPNSKRNELSVKTDINQNVKKLRAEGTSLLKSVVADVESLNNMLVRLRKQVQKYTENLPAGGHRKPTGQPT